LAETQVKRVKVAHVLIRSAKAHEFLEVEMRPEESETEVKPIKDIGYLENLIDEGYAVKGPRQDPSKDLITFKAFLRKGYEFAPEDWLSSNGYQFVEPSTFTKGFRLAYKLIEGFPDERFRSNYSLLKVNKEVPLYLKVEVNEEHE